LTKKNFSQKILMGYIRQKISQHFLNWNILIYISVDAIFDGDYEFDITCVEKCNKKSKIERYEPVWA
jgi:hypothetical protein